MNFRKNFSVERVVRHCRGCRKVLEVSKHGGIGHSLDLMILEGFSHLKVCEILGFSSSIIQGVQGWGEANPE